MRFLKRDVNIALLFLVVFLLLLFVGSNIYYQRIIDNLAKDYSKKQQQLTEVTGKLILEETKANKISELKDITQENIEFFEKDYNKLTNENEILKTEKKVLEQKITGNGIGSCKAVGNAECPD